MLVLELVARPTEELDGLGRERVGEVENVFDVVLGDAEAGVFEKALDGGGGRGGDDFAEEFDLGVEVNGDQSDSKMENTVK
ncbi:hypothetical protein V6N13_127877 [Hibiscus sabdariffa]|uniref:Uncharacterized protein n=1 Tax=Hibiscus sabdariffa TaxID=183260 RepID=A0ABR2CEB6_9ROSI